MISDDRSDSFTRTPWHIGVLQISTLTFDHSLMIVMQLEARNFAGTMASVIYRHNDVIGKCRLSAKHAYTLYGELSSFI